MVSSDIDAKNRDERIQAARKKLKTYRAKQAQAKRGSAHLTSTQAKRISDNVAQAVEDTITHEVEQSQQMMNKRKSSTSTSIEAEYSAIPSRTHSRIPSRAGHGRGHSRAGSISISADSMAATAANAIAEGLRAERIPQSPASGSNAPMSRPSSFIASTPNRRHSRALSRSRESAFKSTIASLGHPDGGSQLLAVERGPDAWGSSGTPADWQDLNERRSPSPLATPKASEQQLSADADFGLATGLRSSSSQPSISTLGHERRQSRHSRKASLSTKRESMEIMGGLGFPLLPVDAANVNRRSRQLNSNRLSGLQSASLLFGVSEDVRRSGLIRDFDWRGSLGNIGPLTSDAHGDGDDRRTALEKLEGKIGSSSLSADTAPSRSPLAPSHGSAKRHSRQSSVQLPTFDEIHGLDGMDKRSSINLLEANERTTEDSPASVVSRASEPSSLGSAPLGGAWASMLSPASALTSSQSLPDMTGGKSPRARPTSLFIQPEAVRDEGLTTLVEEEEEEDFSSPVVERPSMDLLNAGSSAVEDENARKQRRQEERQTAHRTRLSGLQPKPLKLKSRPASLYVSSTVQRAASLLPILDDSNLVSSKSADEDYFRSSAATAEKPEHKVEDRTIRPIGELTQNWSMSQAQNRAKESSEDQQENRRSRPPALSPKNAESNTLVTEAAASTTPTTTPTRPGMRQLRLGSLSASSESSTSFDGHLMTATSPTTPLSNKRGSIRGLESLSASSSLPSMRRSSIMYKSASSEPSSAPAATVTTSSGATLAVVEELKAKNLRDAAQLEQYRQQVERLTQQLTQDAERHAQEYSQLERIAAEEKQSLTARIDDLESTADESSSRLTRQAAELFQAQSHHQAVDQELQAARQETEDLQAERDMLVEDVDGWRTRCKGLEKSLRDERANSEAERCSIASLQVRIQSLTEKLQDAGIEVTGTPTAEDSSSRSLGLPSDLISALKSPALDPHAPTPSGYFSPGANPSGPTPQAVKLLKDMRQQIFNLAGSLDHERKQHLKSQEDAEALRTQNASLLASLQQLQDGQVPASASGSKMSLMSDEERKGGSISIGSGRNKRHVFAYDSSMGSADQSGTSVASGTTNMTSLAEYDQPGSGIDDKAAERDSSHLLGGLQPLPEETDETASDVTSPEGSASVQNPVRRANKHSYSLSSLDLEAGADEFDDDESDEADAAAVPRYSAELSHKSQSSTNYNTPALEPSATFAAFGPAEHHTSDGPPSDGHGMYHSGSKSSHGERSSGSSLETDGPLSFTDHDSSEMYRDDFVADAADAFDPSSGDDKTVVSRPEFIREWSYQDALDAIRLRDGNLGNQPGGKGTLRARRASIDDFFGLLVCEQIDPLPPLPSSQSFLDMPPVYVETDNCSSHEPAHEDVSRSNPGQRVPVPIGRQASVVSSGRGGRPPVARSAFHRDSVNSIESAFARQEHGVAGGSQRDGSVPPGSRNGSLALAGEFGSRALGRMSLQGLTSAFSGLGGYLAGQSGAAAHAAASATAMCAKGDLPSADSRNPSISNWPQQHHDKATVYNGADSLRKIEGVSGAKRFSAATTEHQRYRPVSLTARQQKEQQRQLASSISSIRSGESNGSGARRGIAQPKRFVDKDAAAAPSPSPVWVLDFTPSTEIDGGPASFTI